MSSHAIKVNWNAEGDCDNYVWTLENGTRFAGCAMPGGDGDVSYIDPEEAYLAALSSCHLLSFIAQAAKDGFTVLEYEDEAACVVEKNRAGLLAVTQVLLQPSVKFSEDNKPSIEQLKSLHRKANKYCFIANSVNSKVTIEPRA